MIDIREAETEVTRALKSMECGDSLTFKTFKKDRSLCLTKNESGFVIHEEGYKRNVFENLDEKDAKKLMKQLMKLEFPRSHQLWKQSGKSEL